MKKFACNLFLFSAIYGIIFLAPMCILAGLCSAVALFILETMTPVFPCLYTSNKKVRIVKPVLKLISWQGWFIFFIPFLFSRPESKTGIYVCIAYMSILFICDIISESLVYIKHSSQKITNNNKCIHM